MSSLSQYADPIDGMIAEAELGRRGRRSSVTPDAHEIEHISLMLRHGLRSGIGSIAWELRTEPGRRFEQSQLDEIARQLEDGWTAGSDPDWRIQIRR